MGILSNSDTEDDLVSSTAASNLLIRLRDYSIETRIRKCHNRVKGFLKKHGCLYVLRNTRYSRAHSVLRDTEFSPEIAPARFSSAFRSGSTGLEHPDRVEILRWLLPRL